ncbi:hypothetical protein PISMIDRAFT_98610 [Pisolithus microcarpus 441]|uniref:SAM domain-containing protein n=1 Tax=Pisolithus microcarpus 441 TaxID=765257 RepID=A0A0C9ZQ39_9AGAM|nr:hypothetical protein PISMIDRAFT_98610 [Pisolithus microcarpus 441]
MAHVKLLQHKCDDLSSSADRSGAENSQKKQKKKKKKTCAPKDVDIDEADRPLNKNIRALRDRWVCHKKPGCESEFCFINPLDGGTHIPLTFARLDCWAAAMLKGLATATLETPPNHKHFRMLPDDLVGQRSVLVDCRLQIENIKAAGVASHTPTVPTAPVINVNFPPELFKMFQGSHSIGERMSIQEFGSAYDLSPSLGVKLIEQGYNSMHALHFATIDDLLASGLLRGEIAQLRDAIARWVEN